MASRNEDTTKNQIEMLKLLNLDHLRLDVDMNHSEREQAINRLRRAQKLADMLHCDMEIGLTLSKQQAEAISEIESFCSAAMQSAHQVFSTVYPFLFECHLIHSMFSY